MLQQKEPTEHSYHLWSINKGSVSLYSVMVIKYYRGNNFQADPPDPPPDPPPPPP